MPGAFQQRTDPGTAKNNSDDQKLEPGKPIERELVSGQSHYYLVTLPSGKTFEGKALVIRVALLGIKTLAPRNVDALPYHADLGALLLLYGPDGAKLLNEDEQVRALGDQVVVVEVRKPWTYRLEVRAVERPSVISPVIPGRTCQGKQEVTLGNVAAGKGATAVCYKIWSVLEDPEVLFLTGPRPVINKEGEKNQSVYEVLASGEAHFYQITVPPGRTFELSVTVFNMKIVLTLYGPDGLTLLKEELPREYPIETSYWGTFEISRPGNYRLEVRAKDAVAGRYGIVPVGSRAIFTTPSGATVFKHYDEKVVKFRWEDMSTSLSTNPPEPNILPISVIRIKEDIYREASDRLISEGRLSEAQQVINQLKKEEYISFVSSDDQEPAANVEAEIFPPTSRAELTAEEAEWEKRYTDVKGRLGAIGEERRVLLQQPSRTAVEEERLSALEKDLVVAGQAFQKFIDQLRKESVGNGRLIEKIFHLQEAQALMTDLRELGEGAVAIYTLVGKEKYRMILITPDFQKGYEYPIKAADLNRKVFAFREVLQNPKQDPLPLAQELYRILMGQAAQDLKAMRAATLMWSLDGALRYLPISALHDGERYLVERYRNTSLTPASQTRLKDQPSQQWKALGLGVSRAVGNARPLPAVRDELQGIIREEGARKTNGVLPGTIKLDEAFTFDALRLARRQQYSVVHIASHFQFQPGNEKNSFLLLGDGDILNLAQIRVFQQIFDGVEMLTLSACDTAIGSTGAEGSEVESFAVLAQRQGAKAVVATLWPVADRSTALLMQEFYRLRVAQPGMPKVEALRKAQLMLLYGSVKASSLREERRGGLIQGQKNVSVLPPSQSALKAIYTHPYYWAPFIMIGNWK
jgi:CHAT domain-containing protein